MLGVYMFKSSIFRNTLFMTVMLASTLSVVYSGAAAADDEQCQLVGVQSFTKYGHYIEIGLSGTPNVVGVELSFNNSVTVGNVDVNKVGYNFQTIATNGVLPPYIEFTHGQSNVEDIRVYAGTTFSNSTLNSVRVCVTAPVTIGGPITTTEPATDPGPGGGDNEPYNQCSSSNIGGLYLNTYYEKSFWPLQAPLNVPTGAGMEIRLDTPTNLEGFTLAWANSVELLEAPSGAVPVLVKHLDGLSITTIIGSNGKYKFSNNEKFYSVTELIFQIAGATSGVLSSGVFLGAEVCPRVVDVNALTPMPIVDPPNTPNPVGAYCHAAPLDNLTIDGIPQDDDLNGAFEIDSSIYYKLLGGSEYIDGLEANWQDNQAIQSIQYVPHGTNTWKFVESFTETTGPSGQKRIIFNSQIFGQYFYVKLVGNANNNVISSARACKLWSDMTEQEAIDYYTPSTSGNFGDHVEDCHSYACTVPTNYNSDKDNDGIRDQLEANLARRFFPDVFISNNNKNYGVFYGNPSLEGVGPHEATVPYRMSFAPQPPVGPILNNYSLCSDTNVICLEYRIGLPYTQDFGNRVPDNTPIYITIGEHDGDSEFVAFILMIKAASLSGITSQSDWSLIAARYQQGSDHDMVYPLYQCSSGLCTGQEGPSTVIVADRRHDSYPNLSACGHQLQGFDADGNLQIYGDGALFGLLPDTCYSGTNIRGEVLFNNKLQNIGEKGENAMDSTILNPWYLLRGSDYHPSYDILNDEKFGEVTPYYGKFFGDLGW